MMKEKYYASLTFNFEKLVVQEGMYTYWDCGLCGRRGVEGDAVYRTTDAAMKDASYDDIILCQKCFDKYRVEKPLPEHIEKKRDACLYCGKKIVLKDEERILVFPQKGYYDRKTKTRHGFARKAHFLCWNKVKFR